MANANAKTAKKTKNANRKLFGYDRLKTIDPAFLEPGELETAALQHEQMTALLEGRNIAANPGRKDFIQGEVTIKNKKGIFINIGLKYDAFIPAAEAGNLEIGDNETFFVTSDKNDEGIVTASHVQAKAWEKLKEINEAGEQVSVRVFALATDRRTRRAAGLRVVFESDGLKGVRGFIPNSELNPGTDAEAMVDTVITAKIQGVDPHKGGEFGYLVLSQRDAAKENLSKEIASYSPGDAVTGTVIKFIKAAKNDIDMSVLVTIGNGITGLIYRTEVAGYPRNKANEVLKIGETIEMEVTKVQPELQRISFSMKSLGKKRTLKMLEPGMVVAAQILRAKVYGYFVHIGDGVEGLLHVSDLGNTAGGKKETFQPGQQTEVVILSMEADGSRIALGRRQMADYLKK